MSESISKIPGLKGIDEETLPDGKMRIIFNVEDDQVDEFFKFLGIESRNKEEFEKIIHEALSTYLDSHKEKSIEPRT